METCLIRKFLTPIILKCNKKVFSKLHPHGGHLGPQGQSKGHKVGQGISILKMNTVPCIDPKVLTRLKFTGKQRSINKHTVRQTNGQA